MKKKMITLIAAVSLLAFSACTPGGTKSATVKADEDTTQQVTFTDTAEQLTDEEIQKRHEEGVTRYANILAEKQSDLGSASQNTSSASDTTTKTLDANEKAPDEDTADTTGTQDTTDTDTAGSDIADQAAEEDTQSDAQDDAQDDAAQDTAGDDAVPQSDEEEPEQEQPSISGDPSAYVGQSIESFSSATGISVDEIARDPSYNGDGEDAIYNCNGYTIYTASEYVGGPDIIISVG